MSGGERLSVALCTYNGAKYLREQLDSIALQTYPPDELVVCDDRSVDGSVEIAKTFASRAPFSVRLYVNEEGLGTIKNFERAIGLCKGDFVALSDQDDVWLPNKLEVTLRAMREAEDRYGVATPILVHTDLQVVDSERRPIAPSFYKYQGFKRLHKNLLAELLIENYVTGCTLMMNRALRDAGLLIPREAKMHDWWLALVAAALGCIVSLPEATVLYRQHTENVVGAKKRDWKRYVFDWKRYVFGWWGEFMEGVRDSLLQSKALEEHLRERSSDPALVSFLECYNRKARAGGARNALWIARQGIIEQGIARTIALYMLLLKRGRFATNLEGR